MARPTFPREHPHREGQASNHGHRLHVSTQTLRHTLHASISNTGHATFPREHPGRKGQASNHGHRLHVSTHTHRHARHASISTTGHATFPREHPHREGQASNHGHRLHVSTHTHRHARTHNEGDGDGVGFVAFTTHVSYHLKHTMSCHLNKTVDIIRRSIFCEM
jgi:hypothetical protein